MGKAWPVPKNCEQEGMEAAMEMQQAREQYDRTGDWGESYGKIMERPGRGADYLNDEGKNGHSTFCAGSVFVGPLDESEDIAEVRENAGPKNKSR